MSKRDHEPFIIDKFRGLYARNDTPCPPPGYLHRALNLVYSTPGAFADSFYTNSSNARVREEFEDLGVLPTVPVRFYIYKKSSGYRLMVLDDVGRIWDSVAGLTVLTIPGMIDFHGITLNDRFYITPHNRETGLSGHVVYVYDPDLSSTARKAAGDPAIGAFTVAVSGVNGNIEPGLHVMAVSYKTNTGFITKPALHTTFTAPDPRKRVSVTAIPLGPAGTIERYIWMSQVVINYDGNITAVPLYLAYKIENNTSVSLVDTINPFDTELISSADPYTFVLHEIPAGTYLTELDGRLVVCGPYNSPHTLYISNKNEPENIDSIDGLREVLRGEGTGVKTTRPLHGNIVAWKSNKTAIVRPNDDVPAKWVVDLIDGAIGAQVYGVSEVADSDSKFFGMYLVANQIGLLAFDGTYIDVIRPLSYVIEALWKGSFTNVNIPGVRVIVDTTAFRIYVLIPFEDTTHWYVGDFADGLSAETIRWSRWTFDYLGGIFKNYFDAHVIIDQNVTSTGSGLLAVMEGSTSLRLLHTNTFSTGEDPEGKIAAQFGIKVMERELKDIHIGSVKMVCSSVLGFNNGDYQIAVLGADFQRFTPEITDTVVEKQFEYTDIFPEIVITALGGDFGISKFIAYLRVAYGERGAVS